MRISAQLASLLQGMIVNTFGLLQKEFEEQLRAHPSWTPEDARAAFRRAKDNALAKLLEED